jgi:hypothetical protein
MLTGEGSISILLGVTIRDQLQSNDLGHVRLRQDILEGARSEALATRSLRLVVQHNRDERVVRSLGEGTGSHSSSEQSSLEHVWKNSRFFSICELQQLQE